MTAASIIWSFWANGEIAGEWRDYCYYTLLSSGLTLDSDYTLVSISRLVPSDCQLRERREVFQLVSVRASCSLKRAIFALHPALVLFSTHCSRISPFLYFPYSQFLSSPCIIHARGISDIKTYCVNCLHPFIPTNRLDVIEILFGKKIDQVGWKCQEFWSTQFPRFWKYCSVSFFHTEN